MIIIYKQIYICGALCKFRFGCLYYFMRLYGKKCLRIYIKMLFSASCDTIRQLRPSLRAANKQQNSRGFEHGCFVILWYLRRKTANGTAARIKAVVFLMLDYSTTASVLWL